ncbi:MAG: SDR family NAD(P)-dependent oxidoreductase [Betaproteobacteria bacterium]|jgi:NAD(P)-dependent dehydrogenase (short-subunit alcohol dehydrogenase family)
MNGTFSGKVALVAGGTGGLGRAVSLALLREGADVIVTYMVREELDALQRDAGPHGARLAGHAVDVTDETAVARFVETIIAKHGGLDALVNAVGGYAGGTPLWEMSGQVLDRMLALNLRSGFALSRAVVPGMINRKRGAIVNIAAKAAFDHPAGAAGYAASKAAALALLETLAAELKATGVRVNSILPSIIDTPANRKAMPDADFARWPKPEDIARVILFLCSDNARVIHGAAIPVYGDS